MHKLTVCSLLVLLCLLATAQVSRAQDSNATDEGFPEGETFVAARGVDNRGDAVTDNAPAGVDANGIAATQPNVVSVAEASIDTPAQAQRPPTINEKRRQRGLTDTKNLFVPRGQWLFGGTGSYSTHTNQSYQFFIVDNISSKGYTFRISPMVAYALRDNMAIGGRFVYERTLLKLDKAGLKLGDEDSGIDLTVGNFYALRHTYSVAAIWRQFIPLGQNKRFALFNEFQFAGGGSQARFANDSPVKGTYETGYTLSLGISPGIVAFATNNMAVEVNVGVMGITYTHTKQVHNQVTTGKRDASMMNFKINLFSIGLGMVFYL